MSGMMESVIEERSEMERWKAKEHMSIEMAQNTKESGKMDSVRDMGSKVTRKGISTRGSGRTTLKMEKEV